MARIQGGQKIARHLAARSGGVDVTDTLLRAADRVRTDYIDRLNSPSPGTPQVRYGEGGTKRNVIAANPGEAPNADQGRLAGSAAASRLGRNKTETSVEAEYASMLEFGTDKMAPRPALGPAFDDLRPDIVRNLAKALKDGNRR